jgi:hypothetical protein
MMRRPPERVAAVPIEVTQTKTRIKKSVLAEVYLGFIGLTLRCGLALGERGVHRPVDFSESIGQAQLGLPGQPICHSSPGVKHTQDGRR